MDEPGRPESPFGRRASDRQPDAGAAAAFRITLVVVAVAGVLWLLYALRSLVLLLLLSVFFAYLVAPLVGLAERPFTWRGRPRRVSRGVAIGVVYVVIFGVLALAVAWIAPRVSEQVAGLAGSAPAYARAVEDRTAGLGPLFARLRVPAAVEPLARRAARIVSDNVEAGLQGVIDGLVSLAAYLPWLVLIPILAFFFLKDGPVLRDTALDLLRPGRVRLHGARLFDQINTALAAYMRAQLAACALVAIVAGSGFGALGVPFPVALGVLAGLAEFIPLVGPFAIAVAAAIVAGLHAPILALWVVVFLGALRVTEDYVIYPWLVGHGIHLHPLAVIVAVLAGAELGGVAGVFLSVPFAAVIAAALQEYRAHARAAPASAPPIERPDRRAE
jgi:predicted PurR-regulated permease PerM